MTKRATTARTSLPRPSKTNVCQLPISRTRNPKFCPKNPHSGEEEI
jgi:hypothetical protein